MGKPHVPIEELGLGARAEKALHKLGVVTADKLLALDVSKVLGLPGCGHGVYQRLLSAQKRLHVQKGGNQHAAGSRRHAATYQILRFSTGSWARRCLSQLGVKTLHDLAAVRFVDFMELQGFGLSTWIEIAAVRRQAVQALGGVVVGKRRKTVKDPAVILRRPPTREALTLLPLFSGLEPEFFGEPHFDEGWRTEWKATDLALSVRAFTLCHRASVKNLGQLLLLPGTTFLAERNSHFRTLRRVHDAVESLLLGGLEEQQRSVEYRSFKEMLRSWLNMVLQKTFARVVRERFEIMDNRFLTYEQISRKFGITRARVGQIWDAAQLELCRRQNLLILERFWSAVRSNIPAGSLAVETLAESLAETFAWNEPPSALSLRQLLGFNRELSLFRRGKLVRLKS